GLLGKALTDPASSGRGSELDLSGIAGDFDISGSKIALIGHNQFVNQQGPAGYATVDVSQLNNFGFESVLVGGMRNDNAAGTLITPTANFVQVDTGGQALTVPELLLVAAPEMTTVTTTLNVGGTTIPVNNATPRNNGSGVVTIKAGSVIRTEGTTHEGLGRSDYFASISAATPASTAAALGGTLDSTGTQITGANLLALQLFLSGNNTPLNPSV